MCQIWINSCESVKCKLGVGEKGTAKEKVFCPQHLSPVHVRGWHDELKKEWEVIFLCLKEGDTNVLFFELDSAHFPKVYFKIL